MTSAAADQKYMARALELARRGAWTVSPNPQVGCVLVKDGQVIAEGWHRQAGGPHAEIDAIHQATERVAGSTAYVTLEPCSHTGRTGPCVDALVEHGIERVVIAMEDPNPAVSGQGIERLRKAGIEVECGVQETAARALLEGFVSRMQRNRPRVFAKLASSLDGRTAMANGESQWITGPAARRQVQRLRAACCAIVTGVDTVIKDNPAMTVRPAVLGEEYPADTVRQPLRVVVDSHLRCPLDAQIFEGPGDVVVATISEDEARLKAFESKGIRLARLPAQGGQVDLDALLEWLCLNAECNDVMVECGATLAGSFLRAGLLDELHVFLAPTLLGSDARPLVQMPLVHMGQQLRLNIKDIRAVGDDWWIVASPAREGD